MRTSQSYLTPDEVFAVPKAAIERIRDVLFVSQKGGTLHRLQFFRVSRRLPSLLGSRQTTDTRTF